MNKEEGLPYSSMKNLNCNLHIHIIAASCMQLLLFGLHIYSFDFASFLPHLHTVPHIYSYIYISNGIILVNSPPLNNVPFPVIWLICIIVCVPIPLHMVPLLFLWSLYLYLIYLYYILSIHSLSAPPLSFVIYTSLSSSNAKG